MRTAAAILLLWSAQPAAGGPVAHTTIDAFEMRGWNIMCGNLRHTSPRCTAQRATADRCLRLSFGRNAAYAEVASRCDGDAPSVTRKLTLPYSFFDDQASNGLDALLRESGSRAVLDETAREDVETIAMLLHKITNEPDAP